VCTADYSIERRGKQQYPLLHIFCRDKNYKRVEVLVDDFQPYFYVSKSKEDLKDKFKEILSSERGYVSYDTKEYLVKFYTELPSDVGKLRKILHHYPYYVRTYEADVLFPIRFLIDREIYSGIDYDIYLKDIRKGIDAPTRFRILYVDIETYSIKKEDLENYEAPVIVYGMYDSLSKKYYILSQKEIEKKELEKYLIEKREIEVKIIPKEVKLLLEVRKYFQKLEPDIVLSFSPFDMNYTVRRMNKLGIKYRSLSPMNIVSLRGDSCKISGIQVLDISEMYRNTLRRAKWDTLEFIAEKELQKKALFHDKQVNEMWDTEYKKVILRNLRDVELIRLLDEELQLVTYFDAIRRVVGCNLRDTLYRSRVADILDLRNARKEGYVLPTRKFYYHVDYQGAKVFESKVGIWENILVVDFTAMYPSIIRALNLGYHSIIPGSFNGKEFNIGSLSDYEIPKESSLVVKAFDILEPLRKPFKKKMKECSPDTREYKYYKSVSDGLKSVINAEYGKFGYSGNWNKHIPAARLYNPRVAAFTTAIERKVQEQVHSYLQSKNYEVIYGDTDSLFIKMKTSKKEERIKLLKKLNERVSEFFKEVLGAKECLQLEEDKYFTRLILLSKKRYAGKREDGTFEWKGIEHVRRDQALVTVEIQEELIKRILNGESKRNILKFFKNFLENFKNKSIEEIAIPLKLTKRIEDFKSPSYHLKAFYYSKNELHIPLEEGKRFYLLYVKRVPKNFKGVFKLHTNHLPEKEYRVEAIAFNKVEEIPHGFIIDYDKMKEKTVINKSEDILEILQFNNTKEKRRMKYIPLTKFMEEEGSGNGQRP